MIRKFASLMVIAGLAFATTGCHREKSEVKVKTPQGEYKSETEVKKDHDGGKTIEHKTESKDYETGAKSTEKSKTESNE